MQSAIDLAARTGWHVFPCKSDKTPATPNGYKAATNDPDQIALLWRLWPGELVAIATGAISGIDVVDLDRKHPEAVNWWHDHYSRLLPTLAYSTRSGGVHLYYQHGDGIRNSQGRICTGVDVRGDGGYVVSWGAHGFKCLDESDPAPFPGWVRTALTKPAATPIPPKAAPPSDRALAALVHCVATAREGERNAKLFWAACRIAEQRHADHGGAAYVALIAAAQSAGLTAEEATKTVFSAMRRGAAA